VPDFKSHRFQFTLKLMIPKTEHLDAAFRKKLISFFIFGPLVGKTVAAAIQFHGELGKRAEIVEKVDAARILSAEFEFGKAAVVQAGTDVTVVALALVWAAVASLFFQFFLGLGLALLLDQPFYGRKVVQAVVFLPWAVPSFLSGLTWAWLFNPIIGPLPHWLFALGLKAEPTNVLSDPATAMWGPIIANIWFGIPFFAITLLAALKSIPSELHEAAAIDGASPWQRFSKVTLPFLAPTIVITVMLRTIWIATFADLIFVMTEGGPAGSTSTVPVYIYVSAFKSLDKGYASAVAVLLLVLLIAYAIALIAIRRLLVRHV